jgi:hypothetical protein
VERIREKEEGRVKEALILLGLFIASVVTTAGLYNPYGLDVFSLLLSLPDKKEIYADFAILAITVLAVIAIKFGSKGKTFSSRAASFLFAAAALAAVVAITLFFVKNLSYLALSVLVLGTFLYLFSLATATIGILGMFFLSIFFAIGIVALHRAGVHDGKTIALLSELSLAAIIFIAAAYPRIKRLLFKIGTRDNVDIPNEGVEDLNTEDDV